MERNIKMKSGSIWPTRLEYQSLYYTCAIAQDKTDYVYIISQSAEKTIGKCYGK